MKKPAARPASQAVGVVRLIAGRWRGTRLPVAEVPGLRPTSDRVRETLFNWLMPVLPGARVLDLFAGTGALGLEAASRAAARVVLVERDARAATHLRETLARLEGSGCAEVIEAEAARWLAQTAEQFDVAFVDPPFAAGLWDAVLPLLDARLAPGAMVYVEAPAGTAPPVPPRWRLHREGSTPQVRYALYRLEAGG